MNLHSAPARRKGGLYLDGAKLRERRTGRELTQAALAKIVGTTQNRLAHWETGDEGGPGIEDVALLKGALGCEMTDLMHDEGIARYRALIQALAGKAAA